MSDLIEPKVISQLPDAALPLQDTDLVVVSRDGQNLLKGTVADILPRASITKLAGIAAGATANSSDATLLNRANHTGTQTASTISDLPEAVQDIVGAQIVAGANTTINYNDAAGTITISSTASGSVEPELAITSSRNAEYADVGNVITNNTTSNIVYTITTAFQPPAGTVLSFYQANTGTLTVAAGAGMPSFEGTAPISAPDTHFALRYRGSNVWAWVSQISNSVATNALSFGTGYAGLKSAMESGKSIYFPAGTWVVPDNSATINPVGSNVRYFSFENATILCEGNLLPDQSLFDYTIDVINVEYYGLNFVSTRVGDVRGEFIRSIRNGISNWAIRHCSFIAKTATMSAAGGGPYNFLGKIGDGVYIENNFTDVGGISFEIGNFLVPPNNALGTGNANDYKNIFIRKNVMINNGQAYPSGLGGNVAGMALSLVGGLTNVNITDNTIINARMFAFEFTQQNTISYTTSSRIERNTVIDCEIAFNLNPSPTLIGENKLKGLYIAHNTFINTRTGIDFNALEDSNIIGNNIIVDQDDPVWTAATVYPRNIPRVSSVRPSGAITGFRYEVLSISGTGTSGATEPVWPTTVGATVIDNPGANQIVWVCKRRVSTDMPVRFTELTNCNVIGNIITVKAPQVAQSADNFNVLVQRCRNNLFKGNKITTTATWGLEIAGSATDPCINNRFIDNDIYMINPNAADPVIIRNGTGFVRYNYLKNRYMTSRPSRTLPPVFYQGTTLNFGNIDESTYETIDRQIINLAITAGSGGGASGTWTTSVSGSTVQASGTFTVTAGAITAFTITNAGKGYTSTPTISAATGSFPTGGALTPTMVDVITPQDHNDVEFTNLPNATTVHNVNRQVHWKKFNAFFGASGGATLTSPWTLNLPPNTSRAYTIENMTGQTCTVAAGGTTGTIPTGVTATAYVNSSSNVVIY